MLAVVLATISCFALAVLGLGMLTVLTDTDIIAVPDLGPIPGVVGMVLAVVVFAAMLWRALHRESPSFFAVPLIALATALAHLVGIWVAVGLGNGDAILATAVAGDLVRGGASLVLLVAGAIAGWGGIALRRTRAQQPRWPWEHDDPDEV